MSEPHTNWLLTWEDIQKLPTVEGPSLELTEEEKRELMRPRPNGGIYLSFEDWLESQLTDNNRTAALLAERKEDDERK